MESSAVLSQKIQDALNAQINLELSSSYHYLAMAAFCESVSLPQARTLYGCLQDLPALAARLGHGPALILVGEVFRPAGDARSANDTAGDRASAACRNEPGLRAIA